MELFDKLLPVAATIIGGVLGYLGNYFVEKKNYKRQQESLREERLLNLLDEFIEVLIAMSIFFEDLVDQLVDIENERITKKLENQLEEELYDIYDNYFEYQKKASSLASKIRLGTLIDIREDLDMIYSFFDELGEFAKNRDDEIGSIPIKTADVEYLEDLNSQYDQINLAISEKVASFYHTRFLPEE